MSPAPTWSGAQPPRTIVHLVGRATDKVFAFLGPATQALADSGLQQTVILLEAPGEQHLLPKFDATVRLVLSPARRGPLRSLSALLEVLDREARGPSVAAVHLHGILPCLIGGYAARFRGLPAPLYFSPYGSSGLWRPLNRAAAVLLWLLRPRSGSPARRTITSDAAEVAALQQMTGQPVDLVEASVGGAFFVAARHEARRPLVVTASRVDDPRGAALFAQLAVLLSDEALGLSFNWIGPVDAESTARLKAADVGLLEPSGDAGRIARLASAWIYVDTGSASGFPACLVEAMAMGLPCVAWATPPHQAVLRHGETGLLCGSAAELLAAVASLVDSAADRARLGQAAREEALRRFHRSSLRASLLASYQAPLVEEPPASTAAPPRRRGLPSWEVSEQ